MCQRFFQSSKHFWYALFGMALGSSSNATLYLLNRGKPPSFHGSFQCWEQEKFAEDKVRWIRWLRHDCGAAFHPKKIAWHEPTDMPIISATSVIVIRRFSITIFFTSCIWRWKNLWDVRRRLAKNFDFMTKPCGTLLKIWRFFESNVPALTWTVRPERKSSRRIRSVQACRLNIELVFYWRLSQSQNWLYHIACYGHLPMSTCRVWLKDFYMWNMYGMLS